METSFFKWDKLKLIYLYEFVVFARVVKLSTAAEVLQITESTLSKHIASLEEQLGIRLIDHGRRLELTSAGRHFAECSINILNRFASSVEQSMDIQSSGSRELRVEHLVINTSAANVLFNILRDYFFFSSHIGFQVKQITTPLRHALRSGEIDIGFYCYFDNMDQIHTKLGEDIGFVSLGSDSLVVWGRAGHPIFQQDLITIEDVSRYSVMTMMGDRHRRFSHLAHDCLLANGYELTARHYDERSVESYAEFLMLNPRNSLYFIPESSVQLDPMIHGRKDMKIGQIADGASKHQVLATFYKKSTNASLQNFIVYMEEQSKHYT